MVTGSMVPWVADESGAGTDGPLGGAVTPSSWAVVNTSGTGFPRSVQISTSLDTSFSSRASPRQTCNLHNRAFTLA